ncbi:hypothetical protein [Pedobacter heparinus]|uniref:hypothetical protein n=1 Tax=Pedobacter heparinus TaxID=984 RepID=UPI002931ACF8|nr:hypothetical protein [Pedobacter heparinus]
MRASLILFICLAFFKLNAQVTSIAPGDYKNVIIPNYSTNSDYTNCLILLHEASDGTLINANYAVGTLFAYRGSTASWNRVNIAEINSSSAYNSVSANVTSIFNNAGEWKLKTCVFNGKNYLALDVPYNASHHDYGYRFTGWTVSTGENMLTVPYKISGALVNQDVLSNIQDFIPNQIETHDVPQFNISGDVNIGTSALNSKLAVNGNIRAREIKVENTNWPDYVFAKDYQLPSLQETEQHIKKQGHLPGIPSAAEVKANGINLGEMDAKLLQKIEELTLHLIEKEAELKLQKEVLDKQQFQLKKQQEQINSIIQKLK